MINFSMEGDACKVDGCDGVYHFPPVENCSCHISPPCGACVDNNLVCDHCLEGAQ